MISGSPLLFPSMSSLYLGVNSIVFIRVHSRSFAVQLTDQDSSVNSVNTIAKAKASCMMLLEVGLTYVTPGS